MTSPATSAPRVERRKPAQPNPPKDYGWTLYLIIVTLLLVAGFLISRDHWYKPGDNVGYNMGLVGGLMMLTLLIYPIRKRVGFMKNWIALPKWFKWHMAFGILGPALIMFHSTFQVYIPFIHPQGSTNAAVATLCMLLVSGSGIFGRFFYTKIHYGLYGRHASYKELQENLDGSGDIKSIFNFAPEIQRKLVEFREVTTKSSKAGKNKVINFVAIGIRAKLLARSLIRELEDAMYADASVKKWNDAQMKRLDEMFFQNKAFIETYLVTVRDVAQFSTYEKLFSLWHIFHVPFVYMLAFSAIWHVVAVHMY